jgi:hypothetical protein
MSRPSWQQVIEELSQLRDAYTDQIAFLKEYSDILSEKHSECQRSVERINLLVGLILAKQQAGDADLPGDDETWRESLRPENEDD